MKHCALMIIVALVLCVACTENKVYHHYDHTPLAGWDRAEVLSFDVPAVTDSGRYATDLGLRINNQFPFVNLTLIVEQTVYPSQTHKIDTLNCQLMDKNGKVKGHGVSYYQYHYTVSQMQLHAQDSLHITVRHGMWREILPGISDVGISVTRVR